MAQQVQLPARFANRQNKRSIVAAVTTGLGMASPPYISIKGGSFTLVDANGEKEPVETKWLDCVIFDTNLDVAVQRVYWGDKLYNPNSEIYEPPVCWSDNGIGASAQATEPQSTSCQTCEWNKWGSAVSKMTGKGVKACHVIKKVAVLPLDGKVGQDGSYVPDHLYDFPFLLRVPVMSHDNLRAYGDKFRGQEFDVSDVVTRVSFVHGQTGQLDFAAAGFTDETAETLVQKFLAQRLTDGLVGRGDVPWKGEVRQIAQETQRPLAAPAQPVGAAGETVASQQRQADGPAPFAAVSAEPLKRTRRTKAQMEADAAPQGTTGLQGGIPPFLQRPQAQAQPNGPAPSHGIQPAPAPNAELESALANVFGLKT